MSEYERLEYIEKQRGTEAAIEFANKTLVIYRKAVLCSRKRGYEKPHYASFPEFKRYFIESYLAFKRYKLEHSNKGSK